MGTSFFKLNSDSAEFLNYTILNFKLKKAQMLRF